MDSSRKEEFVGQEMLAHASEHTNEVDAWGFSPKIRRVSELPDATDLNSLPAKGSGCDRDAEEYNMCHPRRGVALIFNHQKFDGMPSRSGTVRDCENLSFQLRNLGFEIRVYNDLAYTELSAMLRKTATEDHSTADCLLVVVMSHGEAGYLHTRDTKYRTQELWLRFTGDKCSTLVGKPKLFFIQACRGTKVDSGVAVDQVDGYDQPYVIPTQADFLIAYSTMEDHYSWRNPRHGAWFIQALCDELRLHGLTRDLLTLLTFVCRRVAIDFRSNVPGNEEMDLKKQVPTITSMLTRLVYFGQKQSK